MTLKPLADRVVIKRLEAEETTKGGINPDRRCQRKSPTSSVGGGGGPRRHGGRQGSGDDPEAR